MHETTHPVLPTQTFFKLFSNIIIRVTKKFSKVKKSQREVPICSSAIKSMPGIYLLFSYEVMGCLPEVLRCKPGALVKGFISTPSFSKTMYNIASSYSFSCKDTHYSGQETTAAVWTWRMIRALGGFSKGGLQLCLWAAQTYVQITCLNQSKICKALKTFCSLFSLSYSSKMV